LGGFAGSDPILVGGGVPVLAAQASQCRLATTVRIIIDLRLLSNQVGIQRAFGPMGDLEEFLVLSIFLTKLFAEIESRFLVFLVRAEGGRETFLFEFVEVVDPLDQVAVFGAALVEPFVSVGQSNLVFVLS